MRKLAFDPTEGVEAMRYEDNVVSVSIYHEDEVKQEVFVGPLFFGLGKTEVVKKLEDFGVKNLSSVEG